MFRALLVDDESLARDGIRLHLQHEADFTVVGEAINGPDAVKAIGRLRPDVVFLDIQIPGYDGFEVLRRASSTHLPFVIFVTAYDIYAVRAFDAHAIDYLLKPLNARRFHEALAQVRLTFGRSDEHGHAHQRVLDLLDARDRGASPPDAALYKRLTVKEGDHFIVIKVNDVDWFQSASNYVELHIRGRRHLIRMTLSELEERLDPTQFMRIHRTTIVNLDRVAEIRPTWQGDFMVALTEGTTLRLSRFYRDRLIGSNKGAANL